jgi:hypothetical protein
MRSRLVNPMTVVGLIALAGCLTAIVLSVLALPALVGLGVALDGSAAPCAEHVQATGFDANRLPNGPVSVDFLRTRPDASLIYPGATVRNTRSEPEWCSRQGVWFDAALSTDLVTPDQVEQVNQWYAGRLLSEGWRQCALDSRFGEFQRGNREYYGIDWSPPNPPFSGKPFTVIYRIASASPAHVQSTRC